MILEMKILCPWTFLKARGGSQLHHRIGEEASWANHLFGGPMSHAMGWRISGNSACPAEPQAPTSSDRGLIPVPVFAQG